MRSPFLILSLAASVSCGDDGMTTPATATIYVQVSAGTGVTGPFAITLDGGSPQTVERNLTVTLEVPAGTHVVQLILPPNCGVGGENPRTVNVSADDPVHIFFGVHCVRAVGTLYVTATSSGPAPASYNVLVNGVDQGTVASNGTQTFLDVYAGTLFITLSNVPANCLIQEPIPQMVTLVHGNTAAVSFTVTCTSPGTI
jgi:hypothetical protein